ncbi:MAG TPA: hypothetical protein DER09_07370 [Prolixibacteraceae bacterium]|nr:hypothetical protein [Prolixibacteraceae bacterium]
MNSAFGRGKFAIPKFRLTMRQTILLLIFFISILNLPAQDKPGWKIDFRTDVYSRHLWRGDRLGDAPAIEPEISLSNNKIGFTIWGATTFDNSYEELDLILNYQVLPALNLVLYDYYNPVWGESNNFWQYSGDNLRHTIDLAGEFEKDGFPLTVLASVFLYGDKDRVADKEQFSTYIEPAYHFQLVGIDFSAFAGFTPFSGYYADNSAFVNLGFSMNHAFQITEKLEIPFELKFCTNPYTKDTRFVVGIGIKNRE